MQDMANEMPIKGSCFLAPRAVQKNTEYPLIAFQHFKDQLQLNKFL